MFIKSECPCHGEQFTDPDFPALCVDCLHCGWARPGGFIHREAVAIPLGVPAFFNRPVCGAHAALYPADQVSLREPVLIRNEVINYEPLPPLSGGLLDYILKK